MFSSSPSRPSCVELLLFAVVLSSQSISVASVDCFSTTSALKEAIVAYAEAGCSGSTVGNIADGCSLSDAVQTFGWPMNNWCFTDELTDMTRLFFNNTEFNDNIKGWDTSKITSMSGLFEGASSFNQDISGWDTSKVEKMDHLFKSAISFNQDLSQWDTSSVTFMGFMFQNATSFQGGDLTGWDTSKVETMDWMFLGAGSFNGDISSWNVGKVERMWRMLKGASSFNQDISSWDMSAVTAIDEMFWFASEFNQDLCDWNSRLTLSYSSLDIFEDSGCTFTQEPKNAGGPFCAGEFCPTPNPTVSPPIEILASDSPTGSPITASAALVSTAPLSLLAVAIALVQLSL